VRSAEVGKIIWLIMGAGIALLFAAITLRLLRRFGGRSVGRLMFRVAGSVRTGRHDTSP